MELNFEKIRQFGLELWSKVPSKAEAWKTLTDNQVTALAAPYFTKYVQPYASPVYKALSVKAKEYPYVAGGVAAVAALVFARTFFVGKAK